MWRVLLVDDEAIVRTGIKTMVRWEDHNFEVVAEAHSGKQALQAFEQHRPHLIISDIKMPGMDGVELLAAIKEKDPETYVVMATNFDEKDHIKEALRLGANDFLSKSELTVERICKLLDHANKQLSLRFKESQNNTINKKSWFLHNWVNKSYTDDKVTEQLIRNIIGSDKDSNSEAGSNKDINGKDSNNESDHDNEPFESVMIYAGYMAPKSATSTEYVVNLAAGIASKYAEAIVAHNEQYGLIYILLIRRGDSFTQEVLQNICMDIKNAARLYADFQIHMGVSSTYKKNSHIHRIADQAEEAHLYATLCDGAPVVFYDNISYRASTKKGSKNWDYIYRLFLCGFDDMSEAINICREAVSRIKDQRLVSLKRVFCSEFCTWYSRMCLKNIGGEQVWIDMQHLLNSYDCDTLLKMLEQSIFSLQSQGPVYQPVNKAIDTILTFIHENYAQPITLEDMAGLAHLNKNYLSTLFSEQTGMSFVNYLTRYRIGKATDLLFSTDMRIQDIAAEVGFSSDRYFSQTFKNITGHSPSHYRNKRIAETKEIPKQ